MSSDQGPTLDSSQRFDLQLNDIVPEYQSKNVLVRYLFMRRLQVAAALASQARGRMLDAGCGSGLLLKKLERRAAKQSLFGVDLNPHVLGLAREGYDIRLADLRQLPYADGFFETVFCLDILEHIEDLQDAQAEIHRVLEARGSLIVSIPLETAFYRFCRLLLKGTTSMEEGPGAGRHYWDGKALLAELRSMFDLEESVSLPVPGPLALFKVVRLRKRKRMLERRPRKVSIVIPVYNEQATILKVLGRVLNAPVSGLEREVIVVDDGSTDGTRELLASVSDPAVRVVMHERNRGKGAALRTGFAHVTGDVVIVQDADLEYQPDEYPLLLRPLLDQCARVVYGSRFTGRTRHLHSSYLFFLGGQVVTWVSNILFGLHLTDEPTCYKVFDAELLRSFDLRCERFEFCPEVTAKVARSGTPIVEVPISYLPRTRDQGKKIGWKDGLEAITTLVRERFRPAP